MSRRLFTALAVWSAMPSMAAAQATSDTLDLPRAVALARAANPVLAARAADVRAAAARIGPAGTLPDPSIRFGAMNYMLPRLSPSGDPMTMNQVSVMQMVPVNGSPGLRRRMARADSARAAWYAAAAALEVEAEVRGRYWALYHDDRALEIMARRRGVLLDIAGVATTMYATGIAAQADALRAQLAVTRLDQQIIAMRLRRFGTAAALNALLGRPGTSPIVVPSPGDADGGHGLHALAMDEPAALDSLITRADLHNPEILGAGAAVTGGRVGLVAARRTLMPDLAVGLAWGQRGAFNDMLSLEIGISLPVFARSRQLRLRDEAGAMVDAAEADLAAVRLRVHAALATAREEAITARRLVALYAQTLVPQAEATYQAALAAYRVGRVDFATLLDAQTALLEYEHDLHEYEAMYGTAVAQIDRLTGHALGAGPRAGRGN